MHEDTEAWAHKHGAALTTKLTTKEIRNLRAWFHALDVDKSGGIGVDELLDPLLSSGLLRCQADVRALIEMADTDHSGEIGFDEFLNAIQKNQLCDRKSLARLQHITNPTDSSGLSPQMRLSEERRWRMMSTVVDETAQRQADIDSVYSVKDMRDIKSHRHGRGGVSLPAVVPHERLEQVARSHYHQKREAAAYMRSLETVVEKQKGTIAKDNAVSSSTRTGGNDGRGLEGTLWVDEDLDMGYKGGVMGRQQSMHRISAVDQKKFGTCTYASLPRTLSDEDYSKYDSQAMLYSSVEVGPDTHRRDRVRKVPRNKETLMKCESGVSECDSDGGGVSYGSAEREGEALDTSNRHGLLRLHSKPLRRLDSKQLKQFPSTDNASCSVLKLKRMKSIDDFVPKKKISIVRHFPKNIVLHDVSP